MDARTWSLTCTSDRYPLLYLRPVTLHAALCACATRAGTQSANRMICHQGRLTCTSPPSPHLRLYLDSELINATSRQPYSNDSAPLLFIPFLMISEAENKTRFVLFLINGLKTFFIYSSHQHDLNQTERIGETAERCNYITWFGLAVELTVKAPAGPLPLKRKTMGWKCNVANWFSEKH